MKPCQQWTFLFIIYIMYLLIGGAVFMALEQQRENDEMQELTKDIDDNILPLNNGTSPINGTIESPQPEATTTKAKVEIVNRISAACLRRIDLLESDNFASPVNPNLKWNFHNSVYFAFSCTTTIGYGHLSPNTNWGKIFTIFFALVGIPINGTLVYGLGNYFGSKLIKFHNSFKKHSGKLALIFDITFYLFPGITIFLILPAAIFTLTENWTFLDAFYFAFTSLTTIGFGDYVAGISGDQTSVWVWLDKVLIILWITFGLGYLIMILGFITKGIKSKRLRIAIEKRLEAISDTKEKLVKEVEQMTDIINDLYILQSQQPKYDAKDYDSECEYITIKNCNEPTYRDRDRKRKISISMPNLKEEDNCKFLEVNLQRMRAKSESNVLSIERERSEFLTTVISALSRKISNQVISAVNTLNEYEAEVLAQKARGDRSRRKNGPKTLNLPVWNIFGNINDDHRIHIIVSDTSTPTPELEQVVIERNQDAISEFNENETNREKQSATASPSISRVSSKQDRKEVELSDFEESGRNEPFGYIPMTDYLNANYCRRCGDPWDKKYRHPHNRDDSRSPSPQISSPDNQLTITRSTLLRNSVYKNRISKEETNATVDQPRRRKNTVEESSLENFLKALDSVHERLNIETHNPNSEIGHGDGSRSPIHKKKKRRRRNGIVNPGYS